MHFKCFIAAALLAGTASPALAQSVKAGIDAWQQSDYSGAVAIWRPLAEKGDPDAEFNLGQAYRLGRGVPTNLAAAKTWFERAANQGHLDAETTLGLLLFENSDQANGLKWLKKAAEQGEPRALLVYGTALVNGDGLTQDPVLGYAYVSRAAAQGLQPAQQTLDQLDRLMTADDKKRGGEIARQLAKSDATKSEQKPVETAVAKTPPKPETKAASKTIATATPPSKSSSKPARALAAAEPATGDWRIQLGAFSQRGNAEALYKKLSGKDALEGRQAFYIPAGSVTRLQVGPFQSKGAAETACRALGVSCFPVSAK
jgi:hypothetical protein